MAGFSPTVRTQESVVVLKKTRKAQRSRFSIASVLCILCAIGGVVSLGNSPSWADPGKEWTILFTADTEGHVGPCRECPLHPGLGGLGRRATAVAQLREGDSSLLILDAGNALIGAESLDSRGKVIIAAYNALGYDAVNLSHHDFWFGKATTLALLKDAKFAVISANLLDDKRDEPLVRPFTVKEIGGQRIAILGVAQEPAGIDDLPHLKEQLAGMRIQPPVEALARWLPKAKAESDRVILLYYGSASGLEPIREKFGSDLAAILVGGVLVGGVRPEALPSDARPPLVGTSSHGREMAQILITGAGPQTKVEAKQLAIEPTITPSPEMEKVLREFKISPSP